MAICEETEIYEAVGRDDRLFVSLVDAFYRYVEADPALRALYPADLAPGKQHLSWFLIQRFGGPEIFNAERGAPMLRRRHAEFAITNNLAERWFAHMSAAIDEIPEFAEHRTVLRKYFEDAAVFLINRDDRREPLQTLNRDTGP